MGFVLDIPEITGIKKMPFPPVKYHPPSPSPGLAMQEDPGLEPYSLQVCQSLGAQWILGFVSAELGSGVA